MNQDAYEAWNDTVPEDADVPFTAAWANVWEMTWGFPPYLASYDDGKNACVMPFHLRPLKDIAFLPAHHRHGSDAITPWYFSGPLLLKGELKPAVKGLMEQMRTFASGNDVANLFVRFHPIATNHKVSGCGIRLYAPGRVAVVPLDRDPEEGYRKGCAYAVRHAEHLGVTARTIPVWDIKALYLKGMEDIGAKPFYKFSNAFWLAVERELKGNFECFGAYTDTGVLAAACMEVFRGPYVTDLLRVTRPEHRTMGVTNLLLDHVFRTFRDRGSRWVNLGGGYGGKDDSQFDFKQSFTDDVRDWYIGKVIWDPKRTLYKLKQTYPEGKYFPAYRRPDMNDQVG